MIRDLKDRLSPSTKKKLIAVGTLVFLLIASFVVTRLTRREPLKKIKAEYDVEVMRPKKKDVDIERLALRIGLLEKELEKMNRREKATEEKGSEIAKPEKFEIDDRRLQELEAKIRKLTDQIQSLQAIHVPTDNDDAVRVPVRTPPVVTVPTPSSQEQEMEEESEPAGELRVIGAEEAEGREEKQEGATEKKISKKNASYGGVSARDMLEGEKANAEKEVFIPSGSIIQGVLLTGLDAPTGRKSSGNPVPALVRIKHDAILPNRVVQDVKECFLIVSGYGSLSTERANLRSERLSCVRPDGGVIETSLDGWVIGEDGKAGLRGRLVSKQGRVIANSIIAGVLSGLAGSYQPQKVATLNITPGATVEYQYPTLDGMLGNAGLGGANRALERVAEYYLEMADEMFPIIEIDAGRKVTVVMVRGAKLKIL